MFEKFEKLLGRIAQGYSRNRKNDTPLHSAIRNFEVDDLEMSQVRDIPVDISPVKILLERDASDINARNSEGETPLHLAVQNKRYSKDLLKLLLDHGADVKATTPRDGNTALHWLALDCIKEDKRGEYSISAKTAAKILLEHGSDVNARNLEGCIPLHYAVQSEDSDQALASLLLERESDVCMKNFKGDTPLHVYLQNRSLPYNIDLFLETSFLDVNVVNSKGESFLHAYVRNANRIRVWVIIAFLNHGADVSIEDAMGENVYQAYCRAAKKYNRTVDPTLQMILQGKKYMNSSLQVACLFHNVDSVHRLLRLGVDVNAVDTFGCSPLFYAYSSATGDDDKRLTILRLLLDFGAQIDHRNDLDITYSTSDTEIRGTIEFSSLLLGMGKTEDSFRYHIFRTEPNDCMLNMYLQHLAKLLSLREKQIERGVDAEMLIQRDGLDLNDDEAAAYDDEAVEYDGLEGYNNWLSLCSEELKTMNDTKIGESRVSFLDLILANPTETLIYAKNNELVKAFHAKKAMFPIYQGMLDAKIDKALGRQELVESAAVSLSNALIFGDPSDEFFVRTLSYCSNKDLMNVIDALDGIVPGQSVLNAAVNHPWMEFISNNSKGLVRSWKLVSAFFTEINARQRLV